MDSVAQRRDARGGAPLFPIGALIGAMVSIQYGATLAKGLFAEFGAEGTTFLRLVAGALILGILLRPWRARPSRHILVPLSLYGVTLAAMNLLFYMALETIPLGIASALQFVGPLLLATLTSRRRIDFVWIALAALGIVLMVPPVRVEQALDPEGVILALAAGACWAFYIVYGQKAGRELGTQTTAIGMTIAAILLLPIGFARPSAALLEPSVLVSAVLIGIFSSALPFSLEMMALTRLPARAYGTLTSMEPVIGAVLGLMLLHEALTLWQWVGILGIVAAVCGTAMTTRTT
ncbi:EamA family transporter [Dongia deserti]|uniref:EamA family transporter n=1 Tax=Dongia deserti TaxID=2268030 RepID=UPI000E656897|nr:DMT family transporter [Dongia deserti]